ncbi:unnamed protein product [Miscanthus lutarioriparius]|uniref:Uncharacterized protein n=1 Tax=Miscanthus lutarioriparius TaxID=422564 RepID=A0A811QBI5_9POAL|nr:unnamed protein product [Miscanthus lutarioriparius]
MVSSAVAQEAVNQVLSRIKEDYQDKSDAKENIERMEMAHIKMEAALETSNKWNVTSAPLLCWRSKLKRASQECDNTLRRCSVGSACKKRKKYSKRLGNDDELRGSTATRRFERFAEGANEFLRYVELGGTPCRYLFFDPLIRHLLAGKGTKYCLVSRGQHLSFLLQPFSPPEHGMEVSLIFLLEDANAPENNFLLALNLQLSKSTNIVGVVVRCLHLFTPHLRSTVETVKTKLTQGDIMIPKAVDCLRGSLAATSYQMLWKSKHGSAYLQVEKISWGLTIRKGMGGKRPKRQQGKKIFSKDDQIVQQVQCLKDLMLLSVCHPGIKL